MNYETLRKQNTEKILQENLDFKNAIQEEDPDYIVDHAYEIVYKDEICCLFEILKFSEEAHIYLASLSSILDTLYYAWMKCDANSFESLEYCIEDFLKEKAQSTK